MIDVSDLIEFLIRSKSVSGVQRVVAETSALLINYEGARCVFMDRTRGEFIVLSSSEQDTLIGGGVRSLSSVDVDHLARSASEVLKRGQTAKPVDIESETVLVILGAFWVNVALMSAARSAHAQGIRIVALLYDLTPLLGVGHTGAVTRLFDRYLHFLFQCAARVPAISESSRLDLERVACERDTIAPAGAVTDLPCGLTPNERNLELRPWPRPYALFVGTVEARKDHLLAWRVWQALVARHGGAAVPDLVCVGRLGWNAGPFLRQYVFSRGLDGKISVLSSSVGDEDLARFYAHAEFTVYPSNYEGWGLPVSESLAFGKVPVVANNSSLPEAGGDLAVYFETGNVDDFVRVIEENVLDLDRRAELEERIRREPPAEVTWEDVANTILHEVEAAEWREPLFPEVELGREYMLAMGPLPPDESHADRYMDYLVREGLTPMLRQPRGERDYVVADPAVIGNFGTPQEWGNEIRPGRYAEFRITRPVDGPLVILVSTRAMPGKATIEVAGPGGPMIEDVYLGSVITIRLGDGKAGEHAMAIMTVTDAHDSIEGFLGIRSFVVLEESDKDSRILALEAAAEALRQELDFIQSTRSWKITAPLRKWKGRGA